MSRLLLTCTTALCMERKEAEVGVEINGKRERDRGRDECVVGWVVSFHMHNMTARVKSIRFRSFGKKYSHFLWGKKMWQFFRANVRGTIGVIAAIKQGLQRPHVSNTVLRSFQAHTAIRTKALKLRAL